ncbi:MAG: NAD(P)H-binding protein, partial [Planctomycetota bacterium]
MNAGAEQPDPVLVTGATGFTGGALARKLRESGVPVRALVRPGSETEKLNALGVDLVEGDLTDLDSVAGAMTGCRRVYHVAATFRTAGHPDSY